RSAVAARPGRALRYAKGFARGLLHHPVGHYHCAPRCTAKSKRTGLPCKSPAVRGWSVCRMHGARSGAKLGKAHPNYRHGERSREAVALRAELNALLRAGQDTADKLFRPD
ncbi:hypothetical protein V8352_21455, partial [Roseovarius sp. D0-M9]